MAMGMLITRQASGAAEDVLTAHPTPVRARKLARSAARPEIGVLQTGI